MVVLSRAAQPMVMKTTPSVAARLEMHMKSAYEDISHVSFATSKSAGDMRLVYATVPTSAITTPSIDHSDLSRSRTSSGDMKSQNIRCGLIFECCANVSGNQPLMGKVQDMCFKNPVHWLRVSEPQYFACLNRAAPLLFDNSISAHDINQGRLGDCWMCAQFAVAAAATGDVVTLNHIAKVSSMTVPRGDDLLERVQGIFNNNVDKPVQAHPDCVFLQNGATIELTFDKDVEVAGFVLGNRRPGTSASSWC